MELISPVDRVDGWTQTMKQPALDDNRWGLELQCVRPMTPLRLSGSSSVWAAAEPEVLVLPATPSVHEGLQPQGGTNSLSIFRQPASISIQTDPMERRTLH